MIALATGWNDTLKAQNFVGVGRSSADSSTIDYQSVVPLSGSLRQGAHGRHPGGHRPSVRLGRRDPGGGRDTDADIHRAPRLLRCQRRQRRRADGERPGRQAGGPAATSLRLAAEHGRPGPDADRHRHPDLVRGASAGQVAHITRNGTALPDVTTGADGSFTFSDTPPAEATYTYAELRGGRDARDGEHDDPRPGVQAGHLGQSDRSGDGHPRAEADGVRQALRLSPSAAGGVVEVTKTDLGHTSGTALADAKVSADGSFTFSDTPQIGGANTYKVTYGGDVSHKPGSAARPSRSPGPRRP